VALDIMAVYCMIKGMISIFYFQRKGLECNHRN